MASHPRTPRASWPPRPAASSVPRCTLEPRVVPSLTFPGIAGITFDTSGDVFVSYDSTTGSSGQQQSVAEVGANGYLVSASVFGTTGASALPGALTTVGSSASLPSIDSSGDILELQPNGQLFVFNPTGGTSSQYDDLPNDTANASNVYDVQTGQSVNLSSQISLTGATFGDFGVYQNSLVVSAESNNWDFVMRVTYGSSGGAATVLVASPASDGLSASPEGVAVDSQGTVLATLPYMPAGSTTAIHVPVGFSLFYDTGEQPRADRPDARPDERPRHRQRRDHGRFAEQLHPGRDGLVALRRRSRGRAHQLRADGLPRRSRRQHRCDSDRDRLPGRGGDELSGAHRRGFGHVYASPASCRSSAARSAPRSSGTPTASTRSASRAPAARPSPATAPARRSPSSRRGSTPRSMPI